MAGIIENGKGIQVIEACRGRVNVNSFIHLLYVEGTLVYLVIHIHCPYLQVPYAPNDAVIFFFSVSDQTLSIATLKDEVVLLVVLCLVSGENFFRESLP